MTEQEMPERTGFDRRGFIKRAAVVGAATAWAAPTIQSLASPAFAAGSAVSGCTSCLTGGGQLIDNTVDTKNGTGSVIFNGSATYGVTLGLGQLCCSPPDHGNAEPQIQVTVHGSKTDEGNVFHFDTLVSITCSFEDPNPAPGPGTATCANVFTGTATDGNGNTLTFRLEDHGEPGKTDYLSLNITGNSTLTSGGVLSNGNLQIHDGIAGMGRDCTGC